MNRIILVGIAGAAILVAALGLNFWLNRDSVLETVTTPEETPRVVAEPEAAPKADTPAEPEGVAESTAPSVQDQAQAGVQPAPAGTQQTAPQTGGAPAQQAADGGQGAAGTAAESTQSSDGVASDAKKAVSDAAKPATGGSTAANTAAAAAQQENAPQQAANPPQQAQNQQSAAVPAPQAQQGGTVKQNTSAAAETAVDAEKPAFDVVRLSQQGDSVMAGRAEPGSTVDIMAGDEAIGSVQADSRGEWVFLPTEPLAPGNHELSLRSKNETGTEAESDHVVVLVVPKKGEDIAGRPTEEESEPLALLVPSKSGEDTESSTVLQKPSAVPGGVEAETGDLALDSVDYDDKGDLALSGRGQPNASVRVYLNNDFVGEAPVDEEGRWQAKPPENVDPGVYDLRVDQVVEEAVVSRLELPFSRSGPITALKDEQLIIVQPGNSLWRIARRTLGEGMAFTVIYDANKNQIRDPDLIYPGQIFQVPKRAVN